MCVDLCSPNVAVPQQLLNNAKICSASEHVRCKTVTKRVWVDVTQACPLGNRRHGEQDSADRLGSFDKERTVYASNSLKGFEENEIVRPAK